MHHCHAAAAPAGLSQLNLFRFCRRGLCHGAFDVPDQSPARTHNDDFTEVVWDGRTHHLTGRQAAVVRILWQRWQAGKPPWEGSRILAVAEAPRNMNLAQLFRNRDGVMSPAWGDLVVRYAKGLYGLPGLEGGGK